MNASSNLTLPKHVTRRYDPIGECIYCSSRDLLTNEHIIPFAAGGRWELPASSCKECAAITGAIEGEVLRTIIGPLRMLYDMPSRRKKERPKHLPLKVKYPTSTDWETAYVDRSICPFLVSLPIYPLPDAITGEVSEGERGAASGSFWIRGAAFWRNKDAHLQWLCEALGAVSVMPTATVNTEPFCLMLAKIAHSFAVAELGLHGFRPFLTEMIRNRDTSNRAHVIGGGQGNEAASAKLHDLEIDSTIDANPGLVVVRVRVLGVLETPTYHVVAGLRST